MVARAPRKKMYRTMEGKMVDIEKLRQANESVQAVGNMNVNARGDVLGPGGQVVTPKADVMNKYYEQPKGRVDDTPARNRPTPIRKTAPETVAKAQPTIKTMSPIESKPAPVQKKQPLPQPKSKPVETDKGGIDAALDGLE